MTGNAGLVADSVSVRLDPEIFEFVSTSAKKRQQAFDDLVLPPRTKNLLKAMVKTHAARSQDSKGDTADAVNEIDLVKGKGKGLIIFLYGPPGVGKVRKVINMATSTVQISRRLADGSTDKHCRDDCSVQHPSPTALSHRKFGLNVASTHIH